MSIFERVKEIADLRKISLQTLAEQSNMGINSIYGWKTKKPSIDKISAVADVLNVSTDYLLGRTDEMNETKIEKVKKADIDDDELLLSFQGKDITPEYRDAIIAILRTMPDRDKDGNII